MGARFREAASIERTAGLAARSPPGAGGSVQVRVQPADLFPGICETARSRLRGPCL
jgi:hypothetical protein